LKKLFRGSNFVQKFGPSYKKTASKQEDVYYPDGDEAMMEEQVVEEEVTEEGETDEPGETSEGEIKLEPNPDQKPDIPASDGRGSDDMEIDSDTKPEDNKITIPDQTRFSPPLGRSHSARPRERSRSRERLDVRKGRVDDAMGSGLARFESYDKWKVICRLLIPSKAAGSVIGKAGCTIKGLREEYGCSVMIPDSRGPERIITIKAADYNISGQVNIFGQKWTFFVFFSSKFQLKNNF